jgi:hypothetical protein
MRGMTLQIMFQAVSTLAVMVGLAYTALQLRAWRATQYVGNFTKLVELQLQLRKMVVDDPTLAPVGLGIPTDNPEETRGFFYNLMQLSVFEPGSVVRRGNCRTIILLLGQTKSPRSALVRPFRRCGTATAPRYYTTASVNIWRA